MYPSAQIIFQSVLPIKVFYNYTAYSVHQFNELILETCKKFGCIFLDNFSNFLDRHYYDINVELYRDKWHLNELGIKILCRDLKFAIYHNLYNPHTRFSQCPPIYY